MADRMQIGAAKRIEISVIISELAINGANPNWPFIGCQSEDVRSLNRLCVPSRLVDFQHKPAAIANGNTITIINENNMPLLTKKLIPLFSLVLNATLLFK